MNISNYLALLPMAIIFGIFYLFILISITSVGIVLNPIFFKLYPIIIKLIRIKKNNNTKSLNKYVKANISIYIFAIFGLTIIVLFAFENIEIAFKLSLCAYVCSFLWNLDQHYYTESIIIQNEHESKSENKSLRVILRTTIVILPIYFSGIIEPITNLTMTKLNIRSEKSTIHIKAPYYQYACEYEVEGSDSIFGDNYRKYENAKILLNGLGDNVAIELKTTEDGKSKKLIIPSNHIHIL